MLKINESILKSITCKDCIVCGDRENCKNCKGFKPDPEKTKNLIKKYENFFFCSAGRFFNKYNLSNCKMYEYIREYEKTAEIEKNKKDILCDFQNEINLLNDKINMLENIYISIESINNIDNKVFNKRIENIIKDTVFERNSYRCYFDRSLNYSTYFKIYRQNVYNDTISVYLQNEKMLPDEKRLSKKYLLQCINAEIERITNHRNKIESEKANISIIVNSMKKLQNELTIIESLTSESKKILDIKEYFNVLNKYKLKDLEKMFL